MIREKCYSCEMAAVVRYCDGGYSRRRIHPALDKRRVNDIRYLKRCPLEIESAESKP